MSLIVNLPGDVCNEILLQWLHFKDICKTDSAVTNKNTRKDFLAFLASLTGLSFNFVSSNSVYDWFYCRNIRLVTLDINNLCFRNGQLAFRVNYEHVREIKVSVFGRDHIKAAVSLSRMANVINSCPFLQSLDCNYSLVSHLDPKVLSNLTMLSLLLDRSKQINSELEFLKCHCTRLQLLTFYSGSCESTAFLDLLVLNPLLKSVTVTCAKVDVFDTIVKHCRIIEEIVLDTDSGTLAQICLFLLERPSIKKLSIKNGLTKIVFINKDGKKEVYLNGFQKEEVEEFLDKIHGIAVVEIMGTKLTYQTALAGIVSHSSHSLYALRVGTCGAIDFSVLSVLKSTCPLLSELEFSFDGNNEIFDFFNLGGQNNLTHLRLFGPVGHLDLSQVVEILKACPHLQSILVKYARVNVDHIIAYKEYVYRGYYNERKAVVDVHFPEEPGHGFTRRLRFMDGRFSGEGMEMYLTKEERMRKPMILSKM